MIFLCFVALVFRWLKISRRVARRVLMHVPDALGPSHGAAGAAGALAVFLLGCLRGQTHTASAAVGASGACVCECHFELPGSGLSAEVLLGLAVVIGGGLLRPTVRACLRALAGLLREAERAFGTAPARPLHLPN